MDAYIGINGYARRICGMWIGIDGYAREITNSYIGIDGYARQFYKSTSEPYAIIGDGSSSVTSWYARYHTWYDGTAGTVITAVPTTVQTSNIYARHALDFNGCCLYCVSEDKVNLSRYKYAYIEIYAECNFGIHFSISNDNTSHMKTNNVKAWATKSVSEISGYTIYYNRMAFDISSISGEYYLKLGIGTSGSNASRTMYIKQLILTNDIDDYDYYLMYS